MNPQDDAHTQPDTSEDPRKYSQAHRSEVGRMLARFRWGDAVDEATADQEDGSE